MKIETLIKRLEELQKTMPNAEIRLNGCYGDSLLFVTSLARNSIKPCHEDIANVIWLEGESDNDMTEEIYARFDEAIEEGLDELDVYSEMLEIGIDVDMVRRYTDDDCANKMETFCKEHGLL